MSGSGSAVPDFVRVESLRKEFPLTRGVLEELRFEGGRLRRESRSVKAINGVDLGVKRGEALCIVGESGCGKSTVARVIMGLLDPTSGSVHCDGCRIDTLSNAERMPYRRRMQMIFQNPYASLNPRMTVRQILEEPVRFHHRALSPSEVEEKVHQTMGSVGIDLSWSDRYPHEFSGGQRQRISIARALSVDPEFLVADEPISALDVSIQAQVLNLLMEAQQARGLTYLFITHDLSVVEHFGTRVAVMYLGKVCELAQVRDLFATPRHPYTQALLSAIPKLSRGAPTHIRLEGEVTTPIDLPTGCLFHPRCRYADARCRREAPQLLNGVEGGAVACHAVEEGRIG